MEELLISASDIIKKSACQILYLRTHPKPQATVRQLVGNEMADKISVGFKEMRGIYSIRDIKVFYSFDEIQINDDETCFIEHKYVENHDEVEDWFFNYSALQIVFYAALHAVNKNKHYETATFMVSKGCTKEVIDLPIFVPDKNKFILQFGGKTYGITLKNPKAIVKYYLQKVESTRNYRDAQLWDNEHKFKDYEFLYTYFDIQPLYQTTNVFQDGISERTSRESGTSGQSASDGSVEQSLGTEDDGQRLSVCARLKRACANIRLRFTKETRDNGQGKPAIPRKTSSHTKKVRR